MGSKAQAQKSAEYAKQMKLKGVRRTSGQCPMGCGSLISNGGSPLISHLGRCEGKRR